MKIKLDTKKIYLAMAERGITATEIAKQGGVIEGNQRIVKQVSFLGYPANRWQI